MAKILKLIETSGVGLIGKHNLNGRIGSQKGGKSTGIGTWKNNDKGNDGKSSGVKRDRKQWGSIGGGQAFD